MLIAFSFNYILLLLSYDTVRGMITLRWFLLFLATSHHIVIRHRTLPSLIRVPTVCFVFSPALSNRTMKKLPFLGLTGGRSPSRRERRKEGARRLWSPELIKQIP